MIDIVVYYSNTSKTSLFFGFERDGTVTEARGERFRPGPGAAAPEGTAEEQLYHTWVDPNRAHVT